MTSRLSRFLAHKFNIWSHLCSFCGDISSKEIVNSSVFETILFKTPFDLVLGSFMNISSQVAQAHYESPEQHYAT